MGNQHLRILGRNIKLTFDEQEGLAGSWQDAASRINISPGQDEWNTKDTLLHEVMHALLTQQGSQHTYKLEESFVRPLATGLMGFFQDNPDVAKWLIKPIKAKS